MVARKSKEGFYDETRKGQERLLTTLGIKHSYKDKEADLWKKYNDYFEEETKKHKKVATTRRIRKIKMKDTHPHHSIANQYFSIKKGDIVTVDGSLDIDETVFDILEENGKPIKRAEKVELNPTEIASILALNNLSNFRAKISELDLEYKQIQQLLNAELANKKRGEWLEFMRLIPAPTDKGIKITAEGMFKRELLGVKTKTEKGMKDAVDYKISQKIIDIFTTKKNLIEALNNNDTDKLDNFEGSLIDDLKRHFKIEKSVATTSKMIKSRE